MHNQVLLDIIPFAWPQSRKERQQELERVQYELQKLQSERPELLDAINHTISHLALHSPYFDIVEVFQQNSTIKHPLYDLLQYLNSFSDNTITQVIRKVNLSNLDCDSDETEFTYSDPYEEQKKRFNLKMMNNVSFPKLQKLLADIYRIGNQSIQKSWILQLTYVDYVKVSVSTLKKALLNECLNETTINTVVQCAKGLCNCSYSNSSVSSVQPKISKLKSVLHQIERFESINFTNLLSHSQNGQYQITDCIWTRQQVLLCIVLFCLLQCEEMISGKQQKFKVSQTFCADDITWNENCFSQIRDYFPKLAKKLNKRYKMLKDIPLFNPKTNNQIFVYSQQLFGYHHHQVNYDQISLNEDLKLQIQQIVNQMSHESDIGLLVIIANARLFVQLMHALI